MVGFSFYRVAHLEVYYGAFQKWRLLMWVYVTLLYLSHGADAELVAQKFSEIGCVPNMEATMMALVFEEDKAARK